MYDDEFSGQGGSYMLDPKTGKRTRIEEPALECAVSAAPIAPDPVLKTKKPAPIDPPQGV